MWLLSVSNNPLEALKNKKSAPLNQKKKKGGGRGIQTNLLIIDITLFTSYQEDVRMLHIKDDNLMPPQM